MIDSQTFVKLVKLMREDYETLGYRSQNFLNAQNLVLKKGNAFQIAQLINECSNCEKGDGAETYVEVEKCIDRILETNYNAVSGVLKYLNEQQKEDLVDFVGNGLTCDYSPILYELYFVEFMILTEKQKAFLKRKAFEAFNSSFCERLIKETDNKQDIETALTTLLQFKDNGSQITRLLEQCYNSFKPAQISRMLDYLLKNGESEDCYLILTGACELSPELRSKFEEKLIKEACVCDITATIKYYSKNNLNSCKLIEGLCAIEYLDPCEILEVYNGATKKSKDKLAQRLFNIKLDDRKLDTVILCARQRGGEVGDLVIKYIAKNVKSNDISPISLLILLNDYNNNFLKSRIDEVVVIIASTQDESATKRLIDSQALKPKQRQLVCKCVNDWNDYEKQEYILKNCKLSLSEKRLIQVKKQSKTAGEQIAELLKTID